MADIGCGAKTLGWASVLSPERQSTHAHPHVRDAGTCAELCDTLLVLLEAAKAHAARAACGRAAFAIRE